MTDEEKKAIDYVKNIKKWWWDNSPDRVYALNKNDIEQFDIILNLIEKQQKEIEEYKNVIDNREFTWKQKYEETFKYVKENYVSKDKIEEIIYPSPDNYIPVEVQMSEMYRKIQKLLKESE